jgi:hypothetical protein
VWINGPFPAGNSEVTIFRGYLEGQLEHWELVETNTGLQGFGKARIPDQGITSRERKQKSVARARHETINGKLKVFNVLVAYFHHHAERDRAVIFEKHALCFGAVAVITQLKPANGETPYDVEYDVHTTLKIFKIGTTDSYDQFHIFIFSYSRVEVFVLFFF